MKEIEGFEFENVMITIVVSELHTFASKRASTRTSTIVGYLVKCVRFWSFGKTRGKRARLDKVFAWISWIKIA